MDILLLWSFGLGGGEMRMLQLLLLLLRGVRGCVGDCVSMMNAGGDHGNDGMENAVCGIARPQRDLML